MTPARILAVGDNVVDCYPDLGVMFPGGNAVNVAVHARRSGEPSGYLGALGSDVAGAVLAEALAVEGVDTSLVRTVEGPNAYAVVRTVQGNRVFESGHVGVSRLTLTDEDLAAIAASELVHTGECSMVEAQLPRIAEVARRVSFDFSERPWDYVESLAPHVDVAVLSAAGTADEPADLAARTAALGPRTVAVTQGELGATLLIDGRVIQAPAGQGPIVDTLGAGDAFIARLLVGLVRGERPDELLAAATRYATSTCAEHGAFGHQVPLPKGLVSSEEVAATT